MQQKKKYHSLSRSNTRITLLEYCEKKYFLNYYTFALKKDFPELRKEALILKQCKSLEMRMGEKTHILISKYLKLLLHTKNSSPEAIQTLKDTIAQEMRQEFQSSKEKNYQELRFGDLWGLSEHYYGEDIDNLLEPTILKVKNNLDALIASSRIKKIQTVALQSQSIYIEEPKKPDFEAMKVATEKIPALKDITIMASPDFGIIQNNKHYFILDRKSGKDNVHNIGITDQLKVYALKVLLKTKGNDKLDNYKIEGHEIYLPSMNSYWGILQQEDIDDIIQKITEDTTFQKTFLLDQDAYKNQPLEANIFSRTSMRKKCENCTLRKVCYQLPN